MKRLDALATQGLVHLAIGIFWGDEGKGKAIMAFFHYFKTFAICKLLASACYQGGPNAGHTLETEEGKTFVAHSLPSGVVFPWVQYLLIGNDCLIDPVKFRAEVTKAENLGMVVQGRLYISKLATLITPYHKILDAASELIRIKEGAQAIGTTGSGIGPAYADAASRDAMKCGMLGWVNFEAHLSYTNTRHACMVTGYATAGLFDVEGDYATGVQVKLLRLPAILSSLLQAYREVLVI